ncbi:MAG: M55 family metallopeptidase, partial [Chloroflexota bacterium]|nr:M55 family metallopeptidase [Chloroflexota bacterium]
GDAVETVAVKESSGRNAALCRPPSATGPEITAAAERALARLGEMPIYAPAGPGEIEVDFLTMAQCLRASRSAGVEQVGPMTARVHGESPWKTYRVLWAALRAALNEPASFLA